MRVSITLKGILFFTFLSCISISSFSQTRSFSLSQVDHVCTDTVTVNLYTIGFKNVQDFRVSVDWNSAVVTNVDYNIISNAFALTGSNINASVNGIGLIWNDKTYHGVTVLDSTILLTMRFAFKNGFNTSINTPITLGTVPFKVSLDTTNGDISGNGTGAVDYTLNPGYINTLVSLPTISQIGSTLNALTTGVALPVGYQWYNITCTPPCLNNLNYSPINNATSSAYNNNNAAADYQVAVTYANGCIDTSNTFTSVVTPLKLLNFNGKSLDNFNSLYWTTTNEINVADFVIERSSDGKTYAEIGTVQASGNTSSERSYSFSDPSVNSSITSYYRMKMMDNNGAYTYSPVVMLSKEGKTFFEIQPNPIVNSTVKIVGSNMKYATIYNMNGKILISKQLVNPDNASFILNNPAKGVYLINIVSADGMSQTEKFLIR